MNSTDYEKLVKEKAPVSTLVFDVVKAFIVGGAICLAGEALMTVFELFMEPDTASLLTSVSLVFSGALLTGIGVYDKIGKFAGAGSLVPITGFANSITASAMEYKPEGFVLGTAAKMFLIAGPVIVYGTVASVGYGVVYWVTTIL